MRARTCPALDRFRLAAAVLVVCNHTSPLDSFSPAADFILTRVLARAAVPFFLMVSGYFLARQKGRAVWDFWRKTALLYIACAALYLPLNIYAGQLGGDFPRRFLADGTFYHLWYFPALLLGVPIAWALSRLGRRAALPLAGLLYLIGLGGDSYYGLAAQVPALEAAYGAIFQVFSHTRNGLFYVPLFLLLGAAGRTFSRRTSLAGFLLSLAAMSGEALWLRGLGVQRHDSMYLLLPLVMLFLFSLLLGCNQGKDRRCRSLSTGVYVLHPWCIVLVRFCAERTGLEAQLVQNSLGHFCAVLVLSLVVSSLLLCLRPHPPSPALRAWREVDLEALSHNAAVLRGTLSQGQELMAVVKADAYGHGAVPVCRRLWKAGVRAFAVACLAEGIALRKAGIRGTILILGYTPPEEVPLLRRWRLTQTVVDAAHGRALSAQGEKVHVHLALDTGMHRLGIPANGRSEIAAMYRLPHLQITGTFSHLCVADSPAEEDIAYTQHQLDTFYDAVAWMRDSGYPPGRIHVQASYGIWNLPSQPCAYARAGIALYGVQSDKRPVQRELDLRPVLSLRARVAAVRSLEPGEAAGYGLVFHARERVKLAVVTIGYGDGIPRDLPQRGGQVLLHGRRCPMVGRMCMDQVLVDVTAVEAVRSGDPVTLIGQNGSEEIQAEDVAEQCGTITNELLSQLNGRLRLLCVRPGFDRGQRPEAGSPEDPGFSKAHTGGTMRHAT